MRISRLKNWLARSGGIMGGLGVLTFPSAFAQSDSVKTVPAAGATAEASVSFSPGVRDVLKMMDAKVDPEVVRAYIKNSPIPFNPTASEIIALKRRDVPDEVITSLMQRGAEVRAQMAQAASQAGPAVAAPYAPPQGPQYDY